MNNQDVIRLISWRVSAMIMPTIGLRAAWSRFCLVSNVLDIMCSVVLKKGGHDDAIVYGYSSSVFTCERSNLSRSMSGYLISAVA
jgi:hypothetical protein